MASASDPPAHPALQPADRLILPPQHPPAAVETSIGPPHYPAECTHSHASVQPSLRARTGHANSDSFCNAPADRVAPAGHDPATETSAPPQPAMHLPMATDLTARAPILAVLVPAMPASRPGLSCPAMPEPWFSSPIAPCRPARCALSGGGFRHLLRACGACS